MAEYSQQSDTPKLLPANASSGNPAQTTVSYGNFPPTGEDKLRLDQYVYFEQLFLGNQWDAFRQRVQSQEFNQAYSKLRYVMANFAGLISKVCADMLFSEPVTIKTEKGDLDFIESLWEDNKMDTQAYESALTNSYEGDAIFKARVGKRNPGDEESSVIFEPVNPRIYFPKINPFSVSSPPEEITLAWQFAIGDKTYLRKEIHTAGKIRNELWLMDGNVIKAPADISLIGIPDLKEEEETGVDRLLVVHIPNFRTVTRHFGISDYYDVDQLFYAINNRLSKIDGILDIHSDPILIVPPGILDENGKPKKSLGRVFERGDEDDGKDATYLTWDASLESTFKELDMLVKMLEMTSELSPDVFGMGEGQSDSGRALKFKLMRTIAKIARKKLYYKPGLEELLYVGQLLAKEYDVKNSEGKSLGKDPVIPDLEFADGLPIDIYEQIETETKAIDASLTSARDAIMRVYGVDEAEADKRLAAIKKETELAMPSMNLGTDPVTGKPIAPKGEPQVKPPVKPVIEQPAPSK